MAQLTETSILINGKEIKQFTSFALQQAIFQHHHFTLTCPAEAIDGSGPILQQSKQLIGSEIQVKINAKEVPGQLSFKGVITEVRSSRYAGFAGDIILSGYSPTIVLDSGPHCKSWEKLPVKKIAQDVLKHFPSNLLNPKVSPLNGETLSYTVQYKETAWQFLSRISAAHGEWFFYDGEKLVLGPPLSNKNARLIYNENLNRFNMALELRPASFSGLAYNYMDHSFYSSNPQEIESKAGLNSDGKLVLQKSRELFGTQPKAWYNQFFAKNTQLDHIINTKASLSASNMVRFDGESGQPGLHVGGIVSVSGKNALAAYTDESFGDYTVVNITHQLDGKGNYINQFTAIPSSIKNPPAGIIPEPVCETQSAIVKENNDPKGLGRVRVKFHWMNGSELSPWMRIVHPHAGGGKGAFFVPEKEEEVIIGFESDSATKGYVLGTVYHGKASNGFSNEGNDFKVIRTRSGHTLEFNDAGNGTHIILKDPGGNEIHLDTVGRNITITAPETMTLNCKNMNINVAQNMNTVVGHNKIQSVGMNNSMLVGMNNNMSVAMMNDMAVGGDNMLLVTGKFMEMIEGDLISQTKKERTEVSEKGIEMNSADSIKKHAQGEIQNNSAEKSKAN